MLLLVHVVEGVTGVAYMYLRPQFPLPPYPYPFFWFGGRLPTVISTNEYLDYCTSFIKLILTSMLIVTTVVWQNWCFYETNDGYEEVIDKPLVSKNY